MVVLRIEEPTCNGLGAGDSAATHGSAKPDQLLLRAKRPSVMVFIRTCVLLERPFIILLLRAGRLELRGREASVDGGAM